MVKKAKDQPATKADLAAARTELKTDLAKVDSGLRADLAKVESGLRADLAKVESGLRADLAKVESGLRTEIAKVESGLRTEIAKVESGLKTEISAVEQRLDQKIERVYISQVQADTELGRKIDRVSDKMDKLYSDLMSAFEKTAAKGAMYDQKAVTHAGILNEHTAELSDHETRITLLEKK